MKKTISAVALTLLCAPQVHAEGPTLFGRFFVHGYYTDANFDADSNAITQNLDVGNSDYGDDNVGIRTFDLLPSLNRGDSYN